MNTDRYCVIMAGGVGSRFWPMSRTNKPKQFLDILGVGKTLLQLTFERFNGLCPPENIYIVTNEDYGDLVKQQLPGLPGSQVLLEPMRKNTAPCIAYASFKIGQINPDAVMVVAPSDHFILKEKEFRKVILEGMAFVKEKDALLTLGIRPNRPETGYGYIQVNEGQAITENPNLKEVKTFTEKPDYDLAKVFFESGDFYWNSGIFIWSMPSVMRAFELYLPEIYSLFAEGRALYHTEKEREFILRTYSNTKSISIDYGVMEKAENVFVLCSDFGWSDLGTWSSLYEHSPKDKSGNVTSGEHIFLYDVNNSIIKVPEDKLMVIQGLDDIIVVESDSVLLVCQRKDEQKIKQFVHDVQIRRGEGYV